MIIRRKHTANFTTIGNALFEDKRLAADEVGVLAWLLSRPNDWEVRRPALMRRWEIGAVSCKRIFNNWLRTGWAQARKTRLSNGTFHIVYEIRDEPGHELSDDEIRDALSLVSSEAESDDDSSGEKAASHPPVTEPPPPRQRGVDDQGVVAAPRPIEDSLKTESPRTESTQGVWAFSDVFKLWPTEHINSLFACEKLHVELPEALQLAAYSGLRPYLDDCKMASRKVCDLATYYRERRWERFQASKPNTAMTSIKPVGPNFDRWREYRERTGDHDAVRVMDLMQKLSRDITVPSPWPPALPPGVKPSTQPISDEDAQHFEDTG